MMLTDLPRALAGSGVVVIETPGWKTRGHGQMGQVKTITCHHTAGLDSKRVIINGRPGLDGPLAHIYLDRQGRAHIIAAGLCWHAGVSLKPDFENSHAIGIEAEAIGIPGTKGDWPAVQMQAYHRVAAALAVHYGLSAADVRGHKETASPPGRKSDPSFDMDAFRDHVKSLMTGDDDMQLTDKVTLTKAQAEGLGGGRKEGDKVSVAWLIMWGGPAAHQLARKVAALAASLEALTKAIAATTPAAVSAAFADGITNLQAELAAVDVRVSLGTDETPEG
jgi:hypothetical protein